MTKIEILPVVDENGKVIGQAPRTVCHTNPALIHPVFHLWIFDGNNNVLLQKRSKLKDVFPGLWDISCASHMDLNETALQTAERELKEELGLDIQELHLHHALNYIERLPHQSEFIYLYYARMAKKSTKSFKFQKEEIDELKWFDIDEALSLYKKGVLKATKFLESELSIIKPHIDIKNVFNETEQKN